MCSAFSLNLLTRPSLRVGHSLFTLIIYGRENVGNDALYSFTQSILRNLRISMRSREYVGGRFNEMKRLIPSLSETFQQAQPYVLVHMDADLPSMSQITESVSIHHDMSGR